MSKEHEVIFSSMLAQKCVVNTFVGSAPEESETLFCLSDLYFIGKQVPYPLTDIGAVLPVALCMSAARL